VSYRILLIDHDPDELERIQRPLAEAGYDVVVATAAEEGMRTFERVRPDLLVIEALLPEKPGSVLCQEIKGTAQGKGMPVVLLLEADEDKQARARALDLHGCDLLIERSIEKEELLGLCEELLKKRQAHAEAVGDSDDQEEQEEPAEPPAAESDEPVAADAAQKKSAERSPAGEENVLGEDGFADALTKLDTIIDEQAPSTERDESQDAEDEEASEAEKSGDFSYLSAEMTRAGAMDQPAMAASDRSDEQEAATAKGSANEKAAAEDEQAPVGQPVAAAAQDEADSGRDISDHIDSVFSGGSSGEPSPAEKKVLSWTFDNGSLPADEDPTKIPTKSAQSPSEQTARPAPAAPSQPPQAAPADSADAFDNVVSWEEDLPKSEPAKATPPMAPPAKPPAAVESPPAAPHAAAAQTASFTRPSPPPRALPRPERRTITPQEPISPKRWWLIAACVAVLAIGGSYLIFFRDGSSAQPAAQSPLLAQARGTERPESTESLPDAAAPTPDGTTAAAPVLIDAPVTPAPEQLKPQASEPRPAPVKPQAARPSRQESKPTPNPARPEPSASASTSRPEPKPTTRPVQPKPATPKPAASERSTRAAPVASSTPPSTSKAPATSKPEPKPVESTRATEPTRQQPPPTQVKPEPKPTTPQAEPASPAPVAAVPVAKPAPQPAVPEATPVKLVNRTEPAYPSKSLKRARGGKIVLKLLINENGRVSRVLVDQGSPHKDLEAAAVGAVLSWKYEPATEEGVPVEAWTTAKFDL
jgi:TonB family protein